VIQPSDLLTPVQLAERLQVSRAWVTEKTRRRCIDPVPHMRIGKYVRFHWPAVSAWLESTNVVRKKKR
jgi:hypothetical protein